MEEGGYVESEADSPGAADERRAISVPPRCKRWQLVSHILKVGTHGADVSRQDPQIEVTEAGRPELWRGVAVMAACLSPRF